MIAQNRFKLDESGKKSCQKTFEKKNFTQKLRHQMVEAETMRVKADAETIKKLSLPHPCFTLPIINAERQAGSCEYQFVVFGLTRQRIEPGVYNFSS